MNQLSQDAHAANAERRYPIKPSLIAAIAAASVATGRTRAKISVAKARVNASYVIRCWSINRTKIVTIVASVLLVYKYKQRGDL
jgi:hypothetical protein